MENNYRSVENVMTTSGAIREIETRIAQACMVFTQKTGMAISEISVTPVTMCGPGGTRTPVGVIGGYQIGITVKRHE